MHSLYVRIMHMQPASPRLPVHFLIEWIEGLASQLGLTLHMHIIWLCMWNLSLAHTDLWARSQQPWHDRLDKRLVGMGIALFYYSRSIMLYYVKMLLCVSYSIINQDNKIVIFCFIESLSRDFKNITSISYTPCHTTCPHPNGRTKWSWQNLWV